MNEDNDDKPAARRTKPVHVVATMACHDGGQARRRVPLIVRVDDGAPPLPDRALMVRRTIRPFTVEVRGSRRKADAPTFNIDEQPDVVWPEALRRELHEDRAEMVQDAVPEKPQGRILPALTECEPSPVQRVEPLTAEVEPEPEEQDEDETVDDLADSMPATPAPADARDETVWERRPRKARETFARGERWKARLPAAIHGMRRKPRDQATD